MPSELLTERRDATLVLTIRDAATRNALSDQVHAAGVEALSVAEADADVRCVVLRGDGAHFSAGSEPAGLARRRTEPREAVRQALDRFHQLIEALRTFPKPVIACVEGTAAGSGCSLALACDLIVAAEDARFVLPQVAVGLTPDGGGAWQLMQALPRQLATQMAWLAEPFTASQLHAHGLVNWVVPPGEALARSLAVAARLADAAAPGAIAASKELLRAWPPREMNEHLAAERECFVQALFDGDAGEGLAAFLERRPPRFAR